jgi:hypothetical protein
MAAIPGWNQGRGWRSARGGGDGGDSRLESGERMAERVGRLSCVGTEGVREGVGPEMVKAWCVGVKPRERKFLRTKFVLHFILFSSRDTFSNSKCPLWSSAIWYRT